MHPGADAQQTRRRFPLVLVVVLVVLGAIGAWWLVDSIRRESRAPVAIDPPTGASTGLGTEWFRANVPGSGKTTLGLLRADNPDAPTVVIFTSTNGLDRGTEAFAARLRDRGVNAVVACWFASMGVLDQIECRDGPEMRWVTDDVVPLADSIVDSARQIDGIDGDKFAVAGMSRGGGVAVLRSLEGRLEPAISVNGLLGGSDNFIGMADESRDKPAEIVLAERADGFHGALMLVWAENDDFVPPELNELPLIDAIRAEHPDADGLRLRSRPFGGHGGLQNPDPVSGELLPNWTADQIVAFVRDQFPE